MDVTSPPEPYRRLSLLDLIGLVAASGLGWGLWLVHARNMSDYWDDEGYLIPRSIHEWINFGSDGALALAWLVILRVPARPGRTTFGSVGCLAVVMVTSFAWVAAMTSNIYHEPLYRGTASLGHQALLSYADTAWDSGAISATVALGWVVLWRVAGWRRAEGSLDRLGRGVGCWFLLGFLIKTSVEGWAIVSRIRFARPSVQLDPAWLAFPS